MPIEGPCAKREVTCTIVSVYGERFVGRNTCLSPQEACPRVSGEGYTKCKTVCKQPAHAEVRAISKAGDHSYGGTAYLEGITHFCRSCQEALQARGVYNLVFGAPPDVKTANSC